MRCVRCVFRVLSVFTSFLPYQLVIANTVLVRINLYLSIKKRLLDQIQVSEIFISEKKRHTKRATNHSKLFVSVNPNVDEDRAIHDAKGWRPFVSMAEAIFPWTCPRSRHWGRSTRITAKQLPGVFHSDRDQQQEPPYKFFSATEPTGMGR